MPESSPESLLQLLQCFLKHPNQIKQIHSRLITNGHLLHNQNPKPSASKWMPTLPYNALIRAHLGFGQPRKTLLLFIHMLAHQAPPNGHTFPPLIKAPAATSSSSSSPCPGSPLHTQVVKRGVLRDPFIQTSFVSFYAQLGKLCDARKVFEEMSEPCVVACNAMIDGYGKSGKCELAEQVFRSMNEKDVVTWTSMVSAYVFNHRPKEALGLFREILNVRIQPDAPALVSVLSAITELGFVDEGKWVHTYISTNKIKLSSGFIASALIDMYAKCGHIENAYHVFKQVSHYKNVGDWNCMISGLAMHGLGHQALEVFLDMKTKEIKPDEITFLGLLSACSHGGLVEEGKFCFKLMQEKYKINPTIQHYGCIIDLLGRGGQLDDAVEIVQNMPMEADVIVWKAILSACVQNGDVAIAESAALKAIELAPEDSSCYILLSNIYAKIGRWDDVRNVRLMMRQRGVRKIPGSSSILVNGKVHEFLVGKEMDVKCNVEVLSKIEEVVSRLKLEGYKPDLTQVLLDIEEENKESSLTLHSEKMALAFGLINTSNGAPIHIVKNLRVCCDCHSFIKLVSRIYNCRVVVRDQNRFHCFENGSCSCKDFW